MKRIKKNNINSEISRPEVIKLEESLTIWNASKVKESLVDALHNSEIVKLSFKNSNYAVTLYNFIKSS